MFTGSAALDRSANEPSALVASAPPAVLMRKSLRRCLTRDVLLVSAMPETESRFFFMSTPPVQSTVADSARVFAAYCIQRWASRLGAHLLCPNVIIL